MRRSPKLFPLLALLLLLAGMLGTALWSAERVGWPTPLFRGLRQAAELEPIRVLPHTEMALVAREARDVLAEGRPWQAWRMLRDGAYQDDAAAPHVLLAARAAAGWDGWSEVRRLLRDRSWLDRAEGGEGLFLLARAQEELGDEGEAAATYQRYLALPGASARGEAQARLGRMLIETGDARGAAAALGAASAQMPEIADWLGALRVEQLARAGDPATAPVAVQMRAGTPPVRLRRVQAEVSALLAASDTAHALRRLEWEGKVLQAQGGTGAAAELHLRRAELLGRLGRTGEARELRRAVAWDGAAPAEARLAAARAMGEADGSVADELARAAAYEAANKPGLAARAMRAAIAAGAPDQGGLQLKLARLLYKERDFGPARVAFRRAAELLRDPELVADAELHAARALYNAGTRGRGDAIEELKRVAERHAGTAAAGTARFILGDVSSTLERAVYHYRRAADVRASPHAREALYRLGDRSLRLKQTGAAIRAWEEYVERYPRGEETAVVAYRTGRMHERAGRRSRARAMYTAATLADPLSYYALLAGDRLGLDPLDRVLAEPRPWVGLVQDAADADAALRRLDALQRVGMEDAWKAELQWTLRSLDQRPAALIALAEGLRDRRHAVEAIRLGRQLLERRGGEWDARLLRVVFPFPYREIIVAEAERKGIDPMLLAGLARQESSFRPDARSWVGATGLFQIMPATGRWLAPAVGIRGYSDRLLAVPEVSARMGAEYLEDMLDRYDGEADLALAAYNAGPGRADRWKREHGYHRDREAWREAIPFDETRHYVKVVLRNAAVYRRLYGE